MEIKTTKLSLFDGLELKEATFRKQSFPNHFHDSYSIGIIENGIEKISFDNKSIVAHANAVVIINPYEVHANSYYDTDSWKYRIIYLSTELMQHVQKKQSKFIGKNIFFPRQLIDDSYLYALIYRLHLNSIDNCSFDLQHILCYLLNTYANTRSEQETMPRQNLLTDAANFIRLHCSDRVTVDQLSEKYGMDKFKFIRLFKKNTGLTPVSYLLLHRINKAKQLIMLDMPIVQVALETGFYDQSHFTHYFRKYIGIAPLVYKKGIVNDI